MIEPYQAIGLVPTMRGIRHRDEIRVNIEHISHLIKAASWLSSLDLPVRLIAIPEGALQGFNDEVLDLDHETFARECAIDVPGPETDALGALARQWDAFVMGQAKARHPEFPGRFFNVGFVLSPEGEIVLRHHKVVPLLPVEHSVTPHNVWDRWIELYGRNLDAFYPVADTEIVGRHDYSAGSSWVAGTIDIEALRKFRASAQWDNWIKDLTTEQYQLIYEEPIYPKNLYLDRAPYTHAEYRREVIDRQIELMHERDVWRRPDKG